ncbi:hypothetical protein LCGC14_1035710 [marine sediment metagenome]|uniref:Uncharacterized protein n=1 Tax=marine sediment metagenome TaxID=412755 RepID=A0A0F9QBH6_9ZZZZ
MPARPLPEFEPLPVPPQVPASDGWLKRIENLINRTVTIVFNDLGRSWFNLKALASQAVNEAVEDAMIGVLSKTAGILTDDEEIPDEIRDLLKSALSGESQGGLAVLGGFGAQMGMGAASGLMAPIMRLINYRMDQKYESARADPAAAIAMTWRTPEFAFTGVKAMVDLGWSQEYMDAWTAVLAPSVNEGDLIRLWRRALLAEPDLDAELKARGWPDDRIEQIKTASEILPGVQDLILMAVREVFAPAERSRLDLDAEFPPEFKALADTLGLAEGWAENYWAAHWQLPSLGQGFEMFHRLRGQNGTQLFSRADLEGLIKAQDFAPVWRDMLVEIAYRPYTRVDVRRMFKDGILDEAQVFAAYEDIGYDKEKAGNLTAWTIAQSGSEEKDLTRAAIIKGYKKKLFTSVEALETLQNIGFNLEQAEFWLSLADLEVADSQASEIIGGVQFLFVNGSISTSDVYARLGPLNMPATQVEELLTVWTLKREAKTTLPGKAELEEFYERGIISEGDFRAGLSERRYRSKEIGWYIDKSDEDIAQRALVEAERAAREQERIIASDLSSEYAVARSGLDVLIAELKLNIAETTLAIKLEPEPEAKQAMKEHKAELAVDVASRKVEKAVLTEALALAKAE